MTQLIVALDIDDASRFATVFHACREAGVTFFKINARALLLPWAGGQDPITYVKSYGCDVFLDLKIYDTRDTVERIACRAFDLGVRFLTVHATPSMLEAAMRAKPAGDYHKVLAVKALTDGEQEFIDLPKELDGLICSVASAAYNRRRTEKLLVCPGIRLPGNYANNHLRPATPAEAKAAGADYIVCGRPIYDAADPVAAARAIMREIA